MRTLFSRRLERAPITIENHWMVMKKRQVIILIAVLAAILVFSLIFLYFYYSKGLAYEGTLTGPVHYPVEISRDSKGAPQIRAKTIEDAYYALGYVHAQDRYNVMEYYRAIAFGRTTPLLGEKGKALDRLSKTIGFSRKAKEIADSIAEPYKNYLKQYAMGINAARKKTIRGIRIRDEWNGIDCIAIVLLKEWANAFLNNRECAFALPQSAQSKELEELIPKNMLFYYNPNESDSIQIIDRIRDLVEHFIGSHNRGMAFYIPSRNTLGDEYLMGLTIDNDLRVYPGWYPVSITLDDITIEGITHVGMPFFFSGTNRFFSFCGFSLSIDTQDFYIEQVIKLNDIVQYLSRSGWRKYEAIQEGLPASGRKEEAITVWATENGPMLNEIFTDTAYKSEVVTISSLFPGPDYFKSLFTIPFSKTIGEASLAVKNVNSLPKVYLFASNDAVVTAFSGKVPIRFQGESVFRQGVAGGWNGLYDLSVIQNRSIQPTIIYSTAFDTLPLAIRNFAIGDSSRALRLQNLIGEAIKCTIRDVEKILYDNHSVYAEKFVPLFVEQLKNSPITSARLSRIYFHEWNFDMDPKEIAPTLYETILQNFIYETCADEIPDRINVVMNNYHLMIPSFYEVVAKGTSPIFDDKRTSNMDESREKIFDKAFFKAMRILSRKKGPYIEDWKWGTLHKGHYRIPFKEKSIMSKMLYKINDIPYGGGNDTIFYGKTDINLKTSSVTSLVGIFNSSIARIHMTFSYSTSPMSRFYYGRMKEPIHFDINFLNKDHTTIITPKK